MEYQVLPHVKKYIEDHYQCELQLRDRDLTVRGYRQRGESQTEDEESAEIDEDFSDDDDDQSVSSDEDVEMPASPKAGPSTQNGASKKRKRVYTGRDYNRGRSLDKTTNLTSKTSELPSSPAVEVDQLLEDFHQRQEARAAEGSNADHEKEREMSPISFRGHLRPIPIPEPDRWDDPNWGDDFVETIQDDEAVRVAFQMDGSDDEMEVDNNNQDHPHLNGKDSEQTFDEPSHNWSATFSIEEPADKEAFLESARRRELIVEHLNSVMSTTLEEPVKLDGRNHLVFNRAPPILEQLTKMVILPGELLIYSHSNSEEEYKRLLLEQGKIISNTLAICEKA